MHGLNKIIFALAFLCLLPLSGWADTLYLKNGRSIDGIIKGGEEEIIELEVNGGAIKFHKNEIERINRSAEGDLLLLRQKWEQDRLGLEQRLAKQQKEEEARPKDVGFSWDRQGIIVKAKLNQRIEAMLVLDTGAQITMLRKSVAEKLGIRIDNVLPDMQVRLADGRQVNAKFIILESVEIQHSRVENVEAGILLDEAGDIGYDGLLGMSFLSKFNFKIDQKEKKLILEKL